MVFGSGPRAKSYGADHGPSFPPHEAAALYDEATARLESSFAQFDAVSLMTLLAAIERKTASEEGPQRLTIAMIELAQALVLRGDAGGSVPPLTESRALVDDLIIHAHLFLSQNSKPSADSKASILARRRMETLLVRHTYYSHHAERVIRAIGEKLKGVGNKVFRMSMPEASRLAIGAALVVENQVGRSRIPNQISRWLHTGTGQFDPAWLALFEIPADPLADGAGIERGAVKALLDRLSLEPQSLKEANPDHLHLANPVWSRPFVKANGRWYCFSPGTLLASHGDVLLTLAQAISGRPAELLGRARGKALEELAAGALRAMLPNAEVWTSVHWTDPSDGKERETDLVAFIDGHVLILEAKSDALSLTSRRGSESWFREVDGIVVKACAQATRLEDVLRHPDLDELPFRADEGENVLRSAAIRNVARFGISLERVTSASYGIDMALRERIERAGGKPMPILTIGDLWLAGELIGSEGRRLHYLLRRSELERDLQFIGDELDLLALYLRTGFVRLWKDPDEKPLAIYGLSELLRHHIRASVHYDPRAKLPKLTTAFWDRLIRDKEERQPKLWTDVVYDLLNVPLRSQERFWRDIVAGRRGIRRAKSGTVPNIALMQAPDQLHPSAFACLITYRLKGRDHILAGRETFRERAEAHPHERLFVFCLDGSGDLGFPPLPYYRGVEWSRTCGPIVTHGEPVCSDLVFDFDDEDDENDVAARKG